LYDPELAVAGEVTVSVAEPLLPGDTDTAAVFHTPAQPAGTRFPRLKVAGAHEELSLLTIVAVKLTGVPEATDWLCEGVTLTLGLAGVHELPPTVTCTVAPLELTEVVVTVTPEAGS
jgi:hypothetical protein